MADPTHHTFSSQRLELHYVDWGNSSAPTLILLHGGRDHCRTWDFIADRLRSAWHIIAPDLRGHGDSAWSPDGHYDKLACVQDLTELVRQRASAPVCVVGHSLGANIALRYAAIFPQEVSRLVAVEGMMTAPEMDTAYEAVPIDRRLREWIEDRRAIESRVPARYSTLDEAVARMHHANPRLSQALAGHLARHGTRRNADGSLSWKFDRYVQPARGLDMPVRDFDALLAAIACPTLLVYGSESPASVPSRAGRLRHFTNASVAVIENAGHWVHHDQPDLFIERLQLFLS